MFVETTAPYCQGYTLRPAALVLGVSPAILRETFGKDRHVISDAEMQAFVMAGRSPHVTPAELVAWRQKQGLPDGPEVLLSHETVSRLLLIDRNALDRRVQSGDLLPPFQTLRSKPLYRLVDLPHFCP